MDQSFIYASVHSFNHFWGALVNLEGACLGGAMLNQGRCVRRADRVSTMTTEIIHPGYREKPPAPAEQQDEG